MCCTHQRPTNATESRAMEDCLKAILEVAQQTDGGGATNGELAARLGLTPGTVTSMVKRLAELHLIEHQPYHGVRLTSQGGLIAQRVLHRHNVLQAFLTATLELPVDQVDEEAERLEHAVSDRLIERISQYLRKAA